MWPAIPLNTVIILSLCELSFLVDFNNAQPDPSLAAGEIESSTESAVNDDNNSTSNISNINNINISYLDEPECSLSNIRQMLGHDDFSLLGISANCLIFFVTGDEIAEGHFDLSRITDKPGKCKDPKPIFYKQDNGCGESKVVTKELTQLNFIIIPLVFTLNFGYSCGISEYKILVAQKKSVYTSGCKWEEHQSYHSCKFSRSAWMKKSVAPDGDVDEIIGHVTDLNTDILHILYTNEEASMFDAMYNISSQNFVATAKIDEASFKISSFDSDLMVSDDFEKLQTI
ncbi:unnamed protein product [Anisakis simplex]|uniref:Sema domain-containing protein n=1 Tax=Anisakis simplex TaxID=6269 RepID=A0A0M3KE80_ANISI|nr:unnamed protein product [Anisakis simplex]